MTQSSHRANVAVLPDPRPAASPLIDVPERPRGIQPPLPFTPRDTPRLHISSRIAPDDRLAITALTQALIETLQGRRPLSQLDSWAHPDVVATIGHLHRARAQTPIVFRSARLQLVSKTAAEVAVHLIADGRSRAVALRLVRPRGRWVCTRLETALWTTVVTKAG